MLNKGLFPNAFTMANLVCGVLAIWFLFVTGSFATSAYFILAAAVLDVFDGLIARMLHVAGEMGKQLDSLADAVTFGVAPGLMVVYLMHEVAPSAPSFVLFSPLFLVVASIYRLAKFNIDTRQSDRFFGLPTPANALFWLSIVLTYASGSNAGSLLRVEVLLLLVGVMSALMVSDLPLLALKFKSLRFGENRFRYTLLVASAASLLIAYIRYGTAFPAVPIVLLLYIVISIFDRKKSAAA